MKGIAAVEAARVERDVGRGVAGRRGKQAVVLEGIHGKRGRGGQKAAERGVRTRDRGFAAAER